MLNWKKWCRLCGAFENIQDIEPDQQIILSNIFEVDAEKNCICIDCNAYIKDFQAFLIKSRKVSEMFADLARKDGNAKYGVDDDFVLQVRLLYELPLPDIEFIESKDDTVTDIVEIDNFKIEEDSMDSNVEYIFESEDLETEPVIDRIEDEEIRDTDQYLSENDDNIKEFGDGFEYLFDNEVDLLTEEEEVESQEECKETDTKLEPNDISQHFEFRCHVCGDKFQRMYFLTTHTKTVHNCSAKVDCTCGKVLASVRNVIHHFETHIKNHSYFQCIQCNKFYKTETHYQNHLQTHHSDSDSDGRKFRCDCGKSFKEARHLVAHGNSHLPDEKKFVHECSYCQKSYSSIFSLRHHIKHVHEKVPTFKCSHCDKMFSRKANLDSHLSHVHTAVRNYECDLCGLKVKTKGILRMHKKIHSTNPEDLLICDVCQRPFKTQNQLTNHKICHSTEKKYKCTLCVAEYKRSKELICHIASAHTGESKYKCPWCSKAFYNNSNYRKHKLKMHPNELEIENLNDDLRFDV